MHASEFKSVGKIYYTCLLSFMFYIEPLSRFNYIWQHMRVIFESKCTMRRNCLVKECKLQSHNCVTVNI